MHQTEQISEVVLNGRSGEAPPVQSFELVDSLGSLDDPAFDVVRLIKYDPLPMQFVNSIFADMESF